MSLAVAGLVLAGCANRASVPEQWWHEYEGGEIAQNRPPPPGADAPYPNYGGFPASKPKLLLASQRAADTAQLTVARNLALASASATVLPVEQTPPPAKPAVNQTQDQAQQAAAPSSLTAPAASASPASAVAAAELPVTVIADIDHPPQLAAAPPAPADLPNVGGATLSLNAAGDFDHLRIGFSAGSEVVPQSAMPAIIAFAQAHQTRKLLIEGYGDAGTANLSQPAAALTLGWLRAGAVAAALRTAGFPAAALRLATHTPAPAPGVGATISLLN